jgi:hypothetical protein
MTEMQSDKREGEAPAEPTTQARQEPRPRPAPVRIRLYGMFTVTRRGYLMQTTVSLVLLGVLLVLWLRRPPLPPMAPKEMTPGLAWLVWLLNALPWLVLVMTALLVLEAVWVLRRFAREEARQKAPLSEKPPTS